nr:MAG TPA: hypothetical protein [Caudoviricetes sp.]
MKIKFLSTLLIAAFTAFQVHAATTGKTLPTEPYVVDGYTPDTRTAEAKETYANRVVKSDVEGNNHSVFGQDNTVEAIHGSTSVYGNQNVVKVNAKDGNIFGDGSSIDGYQSQAIGDNNHLSGEQLSAVGMNNIVTGNHSHAYGGGNNVTGDQTTAVGHYNLVKGHNATSIGYDNKVLSNEGTGVGERVEVSGLNASAFGSLAKATAESALALGSGSQATADSAVAVGNDSVASQKSSVAVGQSSKADGVFGTALGDSSNALANGSVAISVDSQAKGINSMAMGRNALTTHDNSVALGANSVSKIEKPVNEAIVQSITYSGFAGNAPVATVSVGSEGKERQLVNVGAGEISTTSTDAINGSQLYLVADQVGKNAQGIKDNAKAIANNTKAIQTNTADIRAAEALIDKNAKDIAENTKYIQAVEKKLPEVTAGDNVTVTTSTDANGKITYTVSSKDFQPATDKVEAKADKNTKAIETNAKDIADNKASIAKNTDHINAVEVEAKKHSVVKAGKNTTVTQTLGSKGEAVYTVDANVDHLATKAEVVNQVSKVNARIDGVNAKVNTNTKAIHRLDRDVRKNRKRTDAGIASVAAMANIPQVYISGKSGVGVGIGHKHGQSALAVGYSRASDNGHHIIKLSAGIDTQKDVTVGAGYMYQY